MHVACTSLLNMVALLQRRHEKIERGTLCAYEYILQVFVVSGVCNINCECGSLPMPSTPATRMTH